MNNGLTQMGQAIVGASLMGVALLTPFLRTRRTTWGAGEDEVKGSMPGDDIIANPRWQHTQAITIVATPEEIWPWLVQIGQGRGGFCS
jgi:hypothetical protein